MSTAFINVDIEGRAELERKLRTISADLQGQTALNAVAAGGSAVEENAKINIQNVFSKKQHFGGGLAGSITVETGIDGGGAYAVIAPHKVYARIQEFGGTISAKPGGMLKFQIDGQWFQKKQVTLPARPYLAPAMNEHQGEIFSAMREEIERGIQQSV